MSEDVAPAPAPAPAPDEDKIPLLEVLHDLGATLDGSETPRASQLHQVVGAIVKVLDHAGVEVADELWPPEPTVVPRPDTADQVHRQKTNDRLDRVENLLSELLGHVRGNTQEPGE